MKKTTRYFAAVLLIWLLLSQGAPAARAADPKLPSGIGFDELGGKIEEYVSEHENTTAGMSVSVFHGDNTVYAGYYGYADRKAGIAVDRDTVFEWGSATKSLVWISVMQLWEQGKIDLDTDIRRYLPEGFLTNLRYDTPVTMTQLMNHSAGFQEVYADLFVKKSGAVRSLEDALKAHEPEQIYAPGTVTAYSNWGVALAGYIVERISGEDFAEYVHRHIFEPLGMEHSALAADLHDNPWVQEKRKELQCYTSDGVLIPDCFYYINLYPAGMCTSTLTDFEAFGKALLNENSPLFQEKETWKVFFTPTAYLGDREIPSNFHGLWTIPYKVMTVGHGGNTAGCSSYLLLDIQDGVGAVIMTNQSGETVYNMEMPELIFGKFSSQEWFSSGRDESKGIYRAARTVRVGPYKLMSLSFIIGQAEQDELWAVGIRGGVEKICFPYADFVRISVWEFALEIILCVLWIAAALFFIINLLVRLARGTVAVYRKKPTVDSFGSWTALASFAAVASTVLLLVFALLALNYAVAATYQWMSAAQAALGIAMTGLFAYGIAALRKTKPTKKQKFYHWAVMIALAITVVNIAYWNLFMWWKI